MIEESLHKYNGNKNQDSIEDNAELRDYHLNSLKGTQHDLESISSLH